MPVLGLVVHVAEAERSCLIDRLHEHPALTVGAAGPRGLPLVLEADNRDGERAAWDWLHTQPEVAHVDVVFADFADVVSEEVP